MYPNIPRNEGINTMGEYLESCSDKSISTVCAILQALFWRIIILRINQIFYLLKRFKKLKRSFFQPNE